MAYARQHVLGLAPESQGCEEPQYAWPNSQERRIYAVKQAIELLIRQLNMSGNLGYDPARPTDQVGLVWFNDSVPAANVFDFSDDPSALIAAVRSAGSYNGNPYKTAGGTHTAGGLYRASLLLAGAPAVVEELGRTYDYADQVLLITDGIANHFLDPQSANLNGGMSDAATYPADSTCSMLGSKVLENALCMTTDFGGITTGVGGVAAGMNRPITQAVRVSQDLIQPHPTNPAQVWVMAISSISETGLKDGVASSFSQFFAIPDLQLTPSRLTNVDQVMLHIVEQTTRGTCQVRAGPLTDHIAPANIPAGATLPTVGEAVLSDGSGGQVRAPILRDPTTELLSYRFPALPAGQYTLRISLSYRGDDGDTRLYDGIYDQDTLAAQISINLTGANQRQILIAGFQGDVCAP